MRVLFHIPKGTLEIALKHYEIVKLGYYNVALEEVMTTLGMILEKEAVPDFKASWPVSFEDACSVVSNLADQLADADNRIQTLQLALYELQSRIAKEGGP
jgi:hypothetical protein